MKEFLSDSVFFGVAISILAYELGVFLKKKLKLAVFNPLLISIVAVIVFLVAFHIPYESYNEGAKYLSYLLTPATVCLAIPLYEQFELLKQNVAAIFAGLKNSLHYCVDGEGISVTQGDADAKLMWDQVYKMVSTKNNVLVYSNRVNAYVIPRQQLGEKYCELAEIAKEKLPKYRVKLK